MKEKGVLKYLSALLGKRTRKFWVAVVVLLMGGTATAAVMAWEQPSNISVTTHKANVSFQTTVTGVSTNAYQTPININGQYYNMNNISGFSYVSYGNGGIASTVNMNTANFLPGDFVQFKVTVKNTGGTTLLLNATNNNVTIKDYFINSQGQFLNGTSINGFASGNTTFAMNYAGFGNDSLSTFINYLNVPGYGLTTNWLNDWGNLTGPIPHEVAPGQSFTYYLYIGLGSQASYNLPNQYFSISIPLPPAR